MLITIGLLRGSGAMDMLLNSDMITSVGHFLDLGACNKTLASFQMKPDEKDK